MWAENEMGIDQATVRIGTWNTNWAKPGSDQGKRVRATLRAPGCNVLCVTEGSKEILPDSGNVIEAKGDWGYQPKWDGCRKVLLWSEQQWSDRDRVGSDELPPGRFAAGVTDTPVGPLTIIGVCIPWANAHAGSGRNDRAKWQDHKTWLAEFEKLRYHYNRERTVILGDFNQRIPRNPQHSWHDQEAYELLRRAFNGYAISTAGDVAGIPSLVIDHITHTPDMALIGNIGLWPIRIFPRKPLSDHFGVWGDFALM